MRRPFTLRAAFVWVAALAVSLPATSVNAGLIPQRPPALLRPIATTSIPVDPADEFRTPSNPARRATIWR
jgi:hypothetical protein